jgi:hypothetical protein
MIGHFLKQVEYEIQLRVRDNDGAESWSEPVHITIETSTDIKKLENNLINVYPNPVQDYLWIRSENEEAPELSLQLHLDRHSLLKRSIVVH